MFEQQVCRSGLYFGWASAFTSIQNDWAAANSFPEALVFRILCKMFAVMCKRYSLGVDMYEPIQIERKNSSYRRSLQICIFFYFSRALPFFSHFNRNGCAVCMISLTTGTSFTITCFVSSATHCIATKATIIHITMWIGYNLMSQPKGRKFIFRSNYFVAFE